MKSTLPSVRVIKALEATALFSPRHEEAKSLVAILPWLREKLSISEIEAVIYQCKLVLSYKDHKSAAILLKQVSVIKPKVLTKEERIEALKDKLLRDLKSGLVVVV